MLSPLAHRNSTIESPSGICKWTALGARFGTVAFGGCSIERWEQRLTLSRKPSNMHSAPLFSFLFLLTALPWSAWFLISWLCGLPVPSSVCLNLFWHQRAKLVSQAPFFWTHTQHSSCAFVSDPPYSFWRAHARINLSSDSFSCVLSLSLSCRQPGW